MPSPLIAKPRLKTMHRRREAIIRMRGFSESNGVIEGGRRKANWRQQPVCRLRNFTAYRLRVPAEYAGGAAGNAAPSLHSFSVPAPKKRDQRHISDLFNFLKWWRRRESNSCPERR